MLMEVYMMPALRYLEMQLYYHRRIQKQAWKQEKTMLLFFQKNIL